MGIYLALSGILKYFSTENEHFIVCARHRSKENKNRNSPKKLFVFSLCMLLPTKHRNDFITSAQHNALWPNAPTR